MKLTENPDEYYTPTLDLPIRGKIYKVPTPSVADGRYLQELGAAVWKQSLELPLTDAEVDLLAEANGKTWETHERALTPAVVAEMAADGLTEGHVSHASVTALFWIAISDEVAELHWKSADPKASTPGKPARRTPQDRKPATKRPTRKPRQVSAAGPTPNPTPETTPPTPETTTTG
jgi:hypothetical protein